MTYQNEFRKGLLHATPVAMAKINGEHPLVSVIVPVYNPNMPLLEECLDSIRLQTYSRTEIILVDDKSTDPQVFPRLLKWKEAHREKSITALQNEANCGVSWARKNGIDHAAGEYLMLVDQDDFLSYSCIELLLQKAMETNAELVIGGVCTVAGSFNKNNKYDIKTPNDYLLALLNGSVRRTLWGNLIKTASLKRIGFPLAPKNHSDNDVYVLFHFACNFLKIVSLDDIVYFWRHLNSSVSHTMKLQALDDYLKYDQEIFDLLQKQPFYRKIENDIATYMISTYIGKFLTFNGKKASTDFYDQFLKNKVAVKKQSRFKRFILIVDRIYILRQLYIMYANHIKPVLKKRLSRLYIYLIYHHTKC
jgi:glycosyltransferase involved in cell wall biosynthesis